MRKEESTKKVKPVLISDRRASRDWSTRRIKPVLVTFLDALQPDAPDGLLEIEALRAVRKSH